MWIACRKRQPLSSLRSAGLLRRLPLLASWLPRTRAHHLAIRAYIYYIIYIYILIFHPPAEQTTATILLCSECVNHQEAQHGSLGKVVFMLTCPPAAPRWAKWPKVKFRTAFLIIFNMTPAKVWVESAELVGRKAGNINGFVVQVVVFDFKIKVESRIQDEEQNYSEAKAQVARDCAMASSRV